MDACRQRVGGNFNAAQKVDRSYLADVPQRIAVRILFDAQDVLTDNAEVFNVFDSHENTHFVFVFNLKLHTFFVHSYSIQQFRYACKTTERVFPKQLLSILGHFSDHRKCSGNAFYVVFTQ